MDRSRLEAFSDGVFAVAITLLALNIACFAVTGLIAVSFIAEHTPAAAGAGPDADDDDGQVF